MSFLDKLIKNRERTRLEEAVRKDPSPAAFLGLARVLQQEGDLAQARQVARRGAAAFPKDSELAQLDRDLTTLERDAECRRLREQIANFPNGRLYARLAELYRAGGQPDKAVQVASSGLGSFPNHDGLHYVLGLLHADAGAKEEACKHLSRAAELDKFNYSALKLLGRLLSELGRHMDAAETFAKIRGFAPDDEEVKELHSRASRAGGTGPRPAPVPAAARTAPAPGPAVEVRTAPAAPAPAGTGATAADDGSGGSGNGGSSSLLAIALSRIVGKDGIEGAILADSKGTPVASAMPAGQDEQSAAAALAELRRATSPVCGEFGLGGFEEAFLEAEGGGMCVFAMRDMTLGIYVAPRSRAGLIAMHARAFARKIAGSGPEETGS